VPYSVDVSSPGVRSLRSVPMKRVARSPDSVGGPFFLFWTLRANGYPHVTQFRMRFCSVWTDLQNASSGSLVSKRRAAIGIVQHLTPQTAQQAPIRRYSALISSARLLCMRDPICKSGAVGADRRSH